MLFSQTKERRHPPHPRKTNQPNASEKRSTHTHFHARPIGVPELCCEVQFSQSQLDVRRAVGGAQRACGTDDEAARRWSRLGVAFIASTTAATTTATEFSTCAIRERALHGQLHLHGRQVCSSASPPCNPASSIVVVQHTDSAMTIESTTLGGDLTSRHRQSSLACFSSCAHRIHGASVCFLNLE